MSNACTDERASLKDSRPPSLHYAYESIVGMKIKMREELIPSACLVDAKVTKKAFCREILAKEYICQPVLLQF